MTFVAILCLVLPCLNSAVVLAELSQQFLDHNGETRGYQLFVPPAYDGSNGLPLLLVLHGRGGTGERMRQLTGFDLRAAEHHFFVVYPDSQQRYWNYLHSIAGAPDGADDIAFLRRLIDEIGSDYAVDRQRLYVAGISNGGFMAQRLACEQNSEFAAFASVAATGYGAMPATCGARGPVDALYLHGTLDSLVPWQGRRVVGADGESQQVTMSITDSMKFWSDLNRCDPQVEVRDLPRSGRSPQTRVRVYESASCAAGARVKLYGILGGGHNWPGADALIPPKIAGAINFDVHASDAIWSFFDRSRPR
jgi:polyhydroxybutyrate depolymerase